MMRVPSLPRRLLSLLLLGLLTACGGGNSGTSPVTEASTAAQVSGLVMYPPTAGTVLMRASTGSQTLNLVSFPITTSGLYTVTLPAPAQLSAAGDFSALPFLPDPSLLDLQGISCTTRPGISNSAARFAVVTGGSFTQSASQNVQPVGELAPAVQAVGGVTALGITSTLRQYAYADQDTQMTGQLACTVTTTAGKTSPASVMVNYALKRGWNVLTIQTTQQTPDNSTSPSLTVVASAQASLDGVQWRYVPVTP